ncbi:MAG: hypothetical protein HQM16_04890 [Deltaproteobacteria bacterium]|nr:hypothetical protein [Deltaproteobacteria bacterium]
MAEVNEKPLVVSVDHLETKQEVEICGHRVTVGGLAGIYNPSDNKSHQKITGSAHAEEFVDATLSRDRETTKKIEDRYLTYDDFKAFCDRAHCENGSVTAYNSIARRFQKPAEVRIRRMLQVGYGEYLGRQEFMATEGVVEKICTLFYAPQAEAVQYYGKQALNDRGAVTLHYLIGVASARLLTKDETTLVLRVLQDMPDNRDTYLEHYLLGRMGVEGFDELENIYNQWVSGQSNIRIDTIVSNLTECAERFGLQKNLSDFYIQRIAQGDEQELLFLMQSLPEGAVFNPVRERFVLSTHKSVVLSALDILDYSFIRGNESLIQQMDVMAQTQTGQYKDQIRLGAVAWLYAADPVRFFTIFIETIKNAGVNLVVAQALSLSLASIPSVSEDQKAELTNALKAYMQAIKGSRPDEALNDNEIETIRGVREFLVLQLGVDAFDVTDPVLVLEERMRPGGTTFSESTESRNYEFCSSDSSGGYLGPKDDLKATIQGDSLYLKGIGLTAAALARPMALMRDHFKKTGELNYKIEIDGKTYAVEMFAAMQGKGFLTSCPFIDLRSRNEAEYVVTREDGQKFSFAGLLPHLIGVHSFFEGQGTRYRIEPERVAQFFFPEQVTNPTFTRPNSSVLHGHEK